MSLAKSSAPFEPVPPPLSVTDSEAGVDKKEKQVVDGVLRSRLAVAVAERDTLKLEQSRIIELLKPEPYQSFLEWVEWCAKDLAEQDKIIARCDKAESDNKRNLRRAEVAEAANVALRQSLSEVMEWISNWSPDFTDDPAWDTAEAKARAALSATPATAVDGAWAWEILAQDKDGEFWSFVRHVLTVGHSQQSDYMNGKHAGYEEFSAYVDSRAIEIIQKDFVEHINRLRERAALSGEGG